MILGKEYQNDVGGPSWVVGSKNCKAKSLVQTLFLMQINGGNTRASYGLDGHALRQVQKGRSGHVTGDNGKKADPKARFCDRAGIKLTRPSNTKSRNYFVLTTTDLSSPDLGIIDNRIFFRKLGRESESVLFFQLQPDSSFRILYSIFTSLEGFWEDYDFLHPNVAAIPDELDRILMYDMDTGRLESSQLLPGSEECPVDRVHCHEDGTITVQAVQDFPLSFRNFLVEFFVLDYPPLVLKSKVQIIKDAIKDKAGKFDKWNIVDDFLVLTYLLPQRCEYYHLQAIYDHAKPECDNDTNLDIIVLKTLPKPLLVLDSGDEDAWPATIRSYLLVKLSDGIKVKKVTINGIVDVDCKALKEFCVEFKKKGWRCQAEFLSLTPPRIVVQAGTMVKIFQICQRDDSSTGLPSYDLIQVFEKDFIDSWLTSTSYDYWHSPMTGARVRRPSSEMTLEFAVNHFLNQMAVARITDTSLTVYIYDYDDFKLVHKPWMVPDFRPCPEQLDDIITLHFTTRLIVVERWWEDDVTSLFVLNLCPAEGPSDDLWS